MACLRDKFESVLLDGRFETVAPLNHGSFGMVFMARDRLTNEMVAIKCITKKSAADDAGMTFHVDEKSEELALHQRLGFHPNIVNLVHSFHTDAHVYLVLEFCSRGDLYEAIRNGHGPVETERVRQCMLEVVDAVSYMHSKGIYHRDIKPENIFLTQSGTVKLGDFGLATTEKWTTENAVGSDRYMSPEQYDSAGSGYSPAQADIWAIGICLLNVLFSRNPFTTPTEADPIFLDFSRDRQSFFDVFPTMTQDTYNVIMQCMNLDPRKRSLEGARAALLALVNFTTTEELDDDFSSHETRPGATWNREPLRTPSLQSPQIEEKEFFWGKPSQPRLIRQLGTIPDDESCSGDLFAKSDETSADWFTGVGQTPSVSSVLDNYSQFGTSISSAVTRAAPAPKRYLSGISATVGSLPIDMAKPRATPYLPLSGRKQVFSKSWSDMWEEDFEEEERQRQLEARIELNARTWSQESQEAARDSPKTLGVVETNDLGHHDMDDDELVEDGFFPHDAAPAPKFSPGNNTTQGPPPPRRSELDKWAALGERRRAYTGSSEKSVDSKPRRAFGAGVWDAFSSYHSQKLTKDRANDRPSSNRARDWNWRRNRRTDFGDFEWVGGW